MKSILLFLFLSFAAITSFSQSKESKMSIPDSTKNIITLDASCGSCQLGLKGDDCLLAVRIDGKSYYVNGTAIDDHGDAHSKDGFCNAIRKAEAQGTIVDNRFVATYFKLIASPEKKVIKN